MIMRIFAVLVIVLVCCGASCTKEEPPEAICEAGVNVELRDRVRFVEIEEGITAPVADTTPAVTRETTNGEAATTAQTLKVLLSTCNGKLREIDLIEGTDAR